MALMSNKTTSSANATVMPYTSGSVSNSTNAFPKMRTRRQKGSGHEARPGTASKHGLRTYTSPRQSEMSSEDETARDILRRYDDGFRR